MLSAKKSDYTIVKSNLERNNDGVAGTALQVADEWRGSQGWQEGKVCRSDQGDQQEHQDVGGNEEEGHRQAARKDVETKNMSSQ